MGFRGHNLDNCVKQHGILTLSLLMSYILVYGAPSKAGNFNVVYIWTYVWQTLKAVSFNLLHNISTLNQCRTFSFVTVVVNTLLATKVPLITDGI
jgi:hypothetical protein